MSSDTSWIEFSRFDQACRAMLDISPNRQSRQSLQSAFHHLERAVVLVEIDPAMAAFRALTAEEEAATSLMHLLKEKRYKNTDLLRPKDHVQKNAILPFLGVVGSSFASTLGTQFKDFKLIIEDEEDGQRLTIALSLPLNGEAIWAHPIPPLNFTVTSGGKVLSYRSEIEKLVKRTGQKNIIEHLRAQANQRNLLLYAGPTGYPDKVRLPDGFFETHKRGVLVLLRAYLLIQPYKEQLTFVQDTLDAFLNMLGSLKENDLHDFL
nr:hypothetical protein [uncultured Massilia sp.]